MKKIEVGLYWNIDGHTSEVTKIYASGIKCQITETWIAEDSGKHCKYKEYYGIGTDGDEQYVYALDYPEYRFYATGAINWEHEKEEEMSKDINKIKAYWMATMSMGETREQMEEAWSTKEGMEDLMDWFDAEVEAGLTEEEMDKEIEKAEPKKEEKEMAEINNGFEFEGTIYKQTKPGYYFKSTGTVDKKGNPMMKRIAKQVYEQAWDEFVKAAEAEQEAEPAVVTVEGQWTENGDVFSVNINDNEVYVTPNLEDAQKKARELGWVEPGNKPAKVKKPRRSKDVAFEMDTIEGHITLTAKQVDFIKHLPDTSFWENGVESILWCDVLADEIGGQFKDKPMTVGAMISTLREKGLVSVSKDTSRQGHPKAMRFTIIGEVIAEKLGLK